MESSEHTILGCDGGVFRRLHTPYDSTILTPGETCQLPIHADESWFIKVAVRFAGGWHALRLCEGRGMENTRPSMNQGVPPITKSSRNYEALH